MYNFLGSEPMCRTLFTIKTKGLTFLYREIYRNRRQGDVSSAGIHFGVKVVSTLSVFYIR